MPVNPLPPLEEIREQLSTVQRPVRYVDPTGKAKPRVHSDPIVEASNGFPEVAARARAAQQATRQALSELPPDTAEQPGQGVGIDPSVFDVVDTPEQQAPDTWGPFEMSIQLLLIHQKHHDQRGNQDREVLESTLQVAGSIHPCEVLLSGHGNMF